MVKTTENEGCTTPRNPYINDTRSNKKLQLHILHTTGQNKTDKIIQQYKKHKKPMRVDQTDNMHKRRSTLHNRKV